MAKYSYNKPALLYWQQLHQLKQRGLQVIDEQKVLYLLERISYYRLSGYWYPLLAQKTTHTFKQDADFETAFQLYRFDRKLRQIVSAELEKIEVAIRSKLIYILSNAHGPFWFQDARRFTNAALHAKSLVKITEEFSRSDEEFVAAFKAKYTNSLPPAWIALEITSFGVLSMLYKNLKPSKEKREIAQFFGLSDSVFETWLHSIVYLRNVCAHHARLWNRAMSIRPQIPRKPRRPWLVNTSIANNRVYLMLSMVLYLLDVVDSKAGFAERIKLLLDAYPNVDVAAMGFPAGWEKEILWQ